LNLYWVIPHGSLSCGDCGTQSTFLIDVFQALGSGEHPNDNINTINLEFAFHFFEVLLFNVYLSLRRHADLNLNRFKKSGFQCSQKNT
jgi:hypothetical protein